MPCAEKKQERWRFIASLAMPAYDKLPLSPKSSRKEKRWRILMPFNAFKEKKKKLEEIALLP